MMGNVMGLWRLDGNGGWDGNWRKWEMGWNEGWELRMIGNGVHGMGEEWGLKGFRWEWEEWEGRGIG